MGAILRGQAVDVEAHVHLLRQPGDDPFAEGMPAFAGELRGRQPRSVEHRHARIVRRQTGLLVAEVPDADLHERRKRRSLAQRVEHNRGVRAHEALVGFPQVGMRVDVQNAEPRMPLGDGPDQPERHAVLPADHAHRLAGIQPAAGLGVHFGLEPLRPFVDAPQPPAQRFAVGRSARLPMLDHATRLFAQHPATQRPCIVQFGRANPPFPYTRTMHVVQVDLQGRVQYRPGTERRPFAVGHGDVPRHGNQHQRGFLRRKGQSEIVAVGYARTVRIETVRDTGRFFLFHNRRF